MCLMYNNYDALAKRNNLASAGIRWGDSLQPTLTMVATLTEIYSTSIFLTYIFPELSPGASFSIDISFLASYRTLSFSQALNFALLLLTSLIRIQ